MPFVNVKLLESGATREQKAQIIEEITGTLQRVLNKNPENTHVVIEEINPDNWQPRYAHVRTSQRDCKELVYACGGRLILNPRSPSDCVFSPTPKVMPDVSSKPPRFWQQRSCQINLIEHHCHLHKPCTGKALRVLAKEQPKLTLQL